MKAIEFLIKTLKDNPLNAKDMVDIYYETCSDDVDKKRQYYINKGISKTETQLRNQILGELVSAIVGRYKEFFIVDKNTKPQIYSLSDKGIVKSDELFGEEIEIIPDEEVEQILKENIIDNNDIGIVYLLMSKIHKDTYKIGMTNRTLNERLFDLQRDRTYGSYNLTPVIHIKLKNYSLVEQVCHKYFENFRLCRKNDLFIDTELFKTDINFIDEFRYFMRVNFLEHPRLKKDVIEYKEY